jgi:hypothetical protein
MARTTRSSTHTQEKDKHSESASVARTKSASKKRKRASVGDGGDHVQKQIRTAAVAVNGDSSHDLAMDSDTNLQDDVKPPPLPHAGDVPITSDDARKILDILEMYDTFSAFIFYFCLARGSHFSLQGSTPRAYSTEFSHFHLFPPTLPQSKRMQIPILTLFVPCSRTPPNIPCVSFA